MKLPPLHHVQLLLVGIAIGLLIGITLMLLARGNSDAVIVIGLMALGVVPMGVAVLGVIEGSQDSRQRMRELHAEQAARERALQWRVVSPASSKGFARRRRYG